MPVDKSNTTNPPLPSRPFMPTLASNRAAVKSPITPRLAVQHLKATTSPALSTKSPRSDVSTPRNVRSPIEDRSTPARSILSNNVTPRSANRKSRIETTLSTPNESPVTTPVTARATPAHDAATSSRANSGFGGLASAKRPRSVVENQQSAPSPLLRAATFSPNPRMGDSSPRDLGSNFFHASDARPQEAAPAPKKAPTFFYANGKKDDTQQLRSPRAPSPTLSSVTTRSQKSQFYRADGTLEDDTLPPLPPTRILNSRPEVLKPSHSQRPPSPQKADFHLTYRKGASQIISANGGANTILTPTGPGSQSPRRRSITIDPAQGGSGKGHARAGSLSSIDTSSSSRKSSLAAIDTNTRHAIHARNSPTSAPAGPRLPLPPTSNPLPLESLNEALSRRTTSSSSQSRPHSTSISSLPQSPTQPSHQQQVPNYFAEAAANARRERKVLDLEISNSSLLAINRQLEREVRRQKAELRRFRRLSRAGRFSSMGSMLHPNQLDDDAVGSDAEQQTEMSDSDEDLSESDEDPDSSLSDESVESSSLSPDALAQRDATRLAKDEKRLHLDLTRHRQLLVDSQKMNQSLKRCMAWSEEMITEGRRALEYKVRVSDIELGGRVLEHEELSSLAEDTEDHSETGAQGRRGLLGAWSPLDGVTPLEQNGNANDDRLLGLGLGIDTVTTSESWTLPATGGGERDSGVHVDDEHFSSHDIKAPSSNEALINHVRPVADPLLVGTMAYT